ncbi:MAG: SpoIIE family protein phosphatase [Firmicutes bacterium]|nr:SpoIIE family protein phosphatase [Bacillota bacterium]
MYYIDVSYSSIYKHGEELCGDHIEHVNLDDSKILVLADGMGSGVKANILATLTSKIVATMLKEGISLEETIDTIVHTLPVCSQRHLAYSTFTIVKVFRDGLVYVAEFDNPSIFVFRKGKSVPIEKTQKEINGKIIFESQFRLDEESLLVAVSDGVIHAGVGRSLSLGWQWKNVNEYLKSLSAKEITTAAVAGSVLEVCQELYENKAGDDTTVLAVKIREQETINLFSGPPKNPENDYSVIKEILEAEGKVVVCGGTTASIVARTLGAEMNVDLSTMTPEIPPVGIIPRIELVTEGVITINKALSIIKGYMNPDFNPKVMAKLNEKNAASMLARLLIENCDRLNLWIGQAVNPAHQGSEYPMDFNFKMNQLREMARLMKDMGKEVNINYI